MCGIAGLFIQNSAFENRRGGYLSSVLIQMSDRGSDSAGVAVYRDRRNGCRVKLTPFSADNGYFWWTLAKELGDKISIEVRSV